MYQLGNKNIIYARIYNAVDHNELKFSIVKIVFSERIIPANEQTNNFFPTIFRKMTDNRQNNRNFGRRLIEISNIPRSAAMGRVLACLTRNIRLENSSLKEDPDKVINGIFITAESPRSKHDVWYCNFPRNRYLDKFKEICTKSSRRDEWRISNDMLDCKVKFPSENNEENYVWRIEERSEDTKHLRVLRVEHSTPEIIGNSSHIKNLLGLARALDLLFEERGAQTVIYSLWFFGRYAYITTDKEDTRLLEQVRVMCEAMKLPTKYDTKVCVRIRESVYDKWRKDTSPEVISKMNRDYYWINQEPIIKIRAPMDDNNCSNNYIKQREIYVARDRLKYDGTDYRDLRRAKEVAQMITTAAGNKYAIKPTTSTPIYSGSRINECESSTSSGSSRKKRKIEETGRGKSPEKAFVTINGAEDLLVIDEQVSFGSDEDNNQKRIKVSKEMSHRLGKQTRDVATSTYEGAEASSLLLEPNVHYIQYNEAMDIKITTEIVPIGSGYRIKKKD